METIYDHTPTQQELVDLFSGSAPSPEELQAGSADGNYREIAFLMSNRGLEDVALSYVERIVDDVERLAVSMLILECT